MQELFLPRSELVASIRRKPWFDLLILGGDLHAATCAHLAAFQGLKVLLVAPLDYECDSHFPALRSVLFSVPLRSLGKIARSVNDLRQAGSFLLRRESVAVPVAGSADLLHKRLRTTLARLYGLDLRVASGNAGAAGPGCLLNDFSVNAGRLLMERLLAARQEGAVCLNYFACKNIRPHEDGHYVATLLDRQAEKAETVANTNKAYQVNCGVTLDFCRSKEPENALPVTQRRLRSVWLRQAGIFTLRFKNPWLAEDLALTVLNRIKEETSADRPVVPLAGRSLPGNYELAEQSALFREKALAHGVPAALVDGALSRFGARVRFFAEAADFQPVANLFLSGEIRSARQFEQAETLEDLLIRRLMRPVDDPAQMEEIEKIFEASEYKAGKS